MKIASTLAAAALIVAPSLAGPTVATAQEYRSYGHYDPCREQQRHAANNGTVTGGVLGALLGSAVAGRGSRLGGAVVGGTVGAVAGHQVGKSSVRCVAAPSRYPTRHDCRWVEQDYHGHPSTSEVCRGRDGVWRSSGRR